MEGMKHTAKDGSTWKITELRETTHGRDVRGESLEHDRFGPVYMESVEAVVGYIEEWVEHDTCEECGGSGTITEEDNGESYLSTKRMVVACPRCSQ